MKKFIAMMLAVLMVVGMFAGCGAKEEAPAAKAEAPAEVAGAIKLGMCGPLTGGAAAYGDAVNKGAQIAVEEINAADGINGTKIEFRMEDDEHDAEKGTMKGFW